MLERLSRGSYVRSKAVLQLSVCRSVLMPILPWTNLRLAVLSNRLQGSTCPKGSTSCHWTQKSALQRQQTAEFWQQTHDRLALYSYLNARMLGPFCVAEDLFTMHIKMPTTRFVHWESLGDQSSKREWQLAGWQVVQWPLHVSLSSHCGQIVNFDWRIATRMQTAAM